jgi:hypothetical protein
MAEKVYLQWTLENWITVALMAFAGIFLIGLIASAIRHYSGTASVPGTATQSGSASYG